MTPNPSSSPAPGSPPAGRAAIWVLAAVAFGLGALVVESRLEILRLRNENSALRTERDLAQVDSLSSQTQLKSRSLVAENMINELARQLRGQDTFAHLRSLLLLPPSNDRAGPIGVAVWDDARGRGRLRVANLPANDPGQQYRVWVVDASSKRTPCTTFENLVQGAATTELRLNAPISGICVSVEKRGDEPKEGDVIVVQGIFPE